MSKFEQLVAILCSVVMLAGTAVAQSTIPFEDDFEDYNVGDSIIGTNGWMGSNTYATVTNVDFTYTQSSLPLTNSAHSKVTVLNTEGESISNNFSQTSLTNVWIDTMFKVALSDSQPSSITNQTDIQAAFYFNTNGSLVVYHSSKSGSLYSNVFTTVDNAKVQTGEWSRITVTMDYLSASGLGANKFFKIQLDGSNVVSDAAYDSPSTSLTPTGSWFITANRATAPNKYLSSIMLSGTGMFDDFVVTGQEPFFGAGSVLISTLIDPLDGRGGTIMPWGPISLPSGGTTNFNIVASNYWSISSVTTNDATVAGAPSSVTLSNVTENITLKAVFAANTVSNVPVWWLVEYGGNTNNPTLDSDGDGVPDDVEWAGSTDAGNSNTYFSVMTIGQQDGTNYIQWITDAIDPGLGPYKIEKSTNLVDGWMPAVPGTHPRELGTNTWWEAAPAETNVPEFFRVVTTNAF